jgi:hypothetical protein
MTWSVSVSFMISRRNSRLELSLAMMRWLEMQLTDNPVFFAPCFLRKLEIYSGMDSIANADNAAQNRTSARVVIILMRSNFHKRGATAFLRRELARQRLADIAVRDWIPCKTKETGRQYICFAMHLKSAGTIENFQIMWRKGVPFLQTGIWN